MLGLYLDDVRSRTLLSRLDEQRLGRAIEQGKRASQELEEKDGDLPSERHRFLRELVARCEQSTRMFVEANLRLVVSIAKRYRGSRLSMSDLVQEGNLGLLHAVRKFDYKKGFRFSTYAAWWIRQSISRAIASNGRHIRFPAEAGLMAARLLATKSRLTSERGKVPTTQELADELGMPLSRVAELLTSATEPISVSEPVGSDDGREFGETLADPSAEESLEDAIAAIGGVQVERLLDLLDERERRIICLRFGLDGQEPRSRAAVGDCLGISAERVRQVEGRALARLRSTHEANEAWEALGS